MSLCPFLNRHAGEVAWLFGKGPSLSTFEFNTAGKLRFAINDVIAHVPDCLYGFANDGVERWRDVYQPGQILFQPLRAMGEFDSREPGAVACEVIAYEDKHDDQRLLMSREAIAARPTIRRGTLGSALQIMHVMGIKSVYLVGFDGGNAHAPGYDFRTRLRADHYKDYNAIRDAAIDAAFLMGMALRFHNQDHNMETNGKIYVKFTSNSFVRAVPFSNGEVAAFVPTIARELVFSGAAVYFKAEPVDEPIEEATAPIEEAETAATKPKRGRKPKA
jgi:hypothetical protein